MVQSAQGLLSVLDEPDTALQAHALASINQRIDNLWAEVADSIVRIEALSEDSAFPSRQLASLVASKVYYHLGNLAEALSFALGAGKLFDVERAADVSPSEAEYVDTIISQAIDSYTTSRTAVATGAGATPAGVDPSAVAGDIDARLEAIVERMFERCERDGEHKQALGIAMASHRLDVIERVFRNTRDAGLLEWILQLIVRESVAIGGSSRSYKNEILRLLIKLYESLAHPDYFSITQCFVYLNDPSLASSLLKSLLQLDTAPASAAPKDDDVLTAYQIAFDLAETATQEFLQVVRSSLEGPRAADATGAEGSAAAPQAQEQEAAQPKEGAELHRERLTAILSGEESIKLYLEFLYRNNKADLLILKNTLDALEPRNSIYHSAVSLMNAFAHAGTTSDLFLRENLDFLGKASNWSKFTTTAALGVIHKGNLAQGKAILEPYLPSADGSGGGGPSGSVYSEGGSLYALGLVNANHGKEDIVRYLLDTMKSSQDEVIQHGAALGLGVAAMGSGNEELYDELRNILFTDSAVAGEAAAYAMGLVMLGTASEKALDEMLQYAHETQHEKIIRGLAVGTAFLVFGKEEEADQVIETLLGDADAILRYGAMYATALAYAGTGNNKAIRKLLHVAVSDVNDDVRRAAVTALGFILFRNPTQVPRIVQLLSESYNPHVRYGSALALGISCAGTGLEEAISLLEPLTKDPVDFVRQGACMSLAMILIEQNETSHPKVASTREIYKKMVNDKHADPMAKFGAALSQGIIDAGGRNVTISMQNKSGSGNMPAIVGMALFAQFWYWFPLAHCLSLAFTPTAIIGLTHDLKLPKFDFVSNARPSLFAYQPATKPPEKETVEKVKTAILSTTAKTTARAKAKEAEQKGDEAMQTDDKADEKTEEKKDDKKEDDAEMKDDSASVEGGDAAAGAAASSSGDKKKDGKTARKQPEPTFSRLENLSRVVPTQLQYISFPADSRYVPVRPVNAGSITASNASVALSRLSSPVGTGGGILLMRDTRPGEEAEYLELEVLKAIDTTPAAPGAAAQAGATATGASEQSDSDLASAPIAATPAPFEWTDWGA